MILAPEACSLHNLFGQNTDELFRYVSLCIKIFLLIHQSAPLFSVYSDEHINCKLLDSFRSNLNLFGRVSSTESFSIVYTAELHKNRAHKNLLWLDIHGFPRACLLLNSITAWSKVLLACWHTRIWLWHESFNTSRAGSPTIIIQSTFSERNIAISDAWFAKIKWEPQDQWPVLAPKQFDQAAHMLHVKNGCQNIF